MVWEQLFSEEMIMASGPFHKAILYCIANMPDAGLEVLSTLIKDTDIANGHDKIIAAWEERIQTFRWDACFIRTLEDLRARKKIWESQLREVVSFPSPPK